MSTQHGVAATAGHLASNGGIRGHSAGDVFPFIVVGTGDDMWHVQLPDGRMFGTYYHAKTAHDTAVLLKQIREKMDISKMSIAHIRIVHIHLMRGGVL
jgi:hypothetical protein